MNHHARPRPIAPTTVDVDSCGCAGCIVLVVFFLAIVGAASIVIDILF